MKVLVLAVCLAIAPSTWAVNRCATTDGQVTYTDQPCRAGQREQWRLKQTTGPAGFPPRPVPMAQPASGGADSPECKQAHRHLEIEEGASLTKQPPAKAGGFVLRTESPDTRRLNDASNRAPSGNCRRG
jgi:hypothetical protein